MRHVPQRRKWGKGQHASNPRPGQREHRAKEKDNQMLVNNKVVEVEVEVDVPLKCVQGKKQSFALLSAVPCRK